MSNQSARHYHCFLLQQKDDVTICLNRFVFELKSQIILIREGQLGCELHIGPNGLSHRVVGGCDLCNVVGNVHSKSSSQSSSAGNVTKLGKSCLRNGAFCHILNDLKTRQSIFGHHCHITCCSVCFFTTHAPHQTSHNELCEVLYRFRTYRKSLYTRHTHAGRASFSLS